MTGQNCQRPSKIWSAWTFDCATTKPYFNLWACYKWRCCNGARLCVCVCSWALGQCCLFCEWLTASMWFVYLLNGCSHFQVWLQATWSRLYVGCLPINVTWAIKWPIRCMYGKSDWLVQFLILRSWCINFDVRMEDLALLVRHCWHVNTLKAGGLCRGGSHRVAQVQGIHFP